MIDRNGNGENHGVAREVVIRRRMRPITNCLNKMTSSRMEWIIFWFSAQSKFPDPLKQLRPAGSEPSDLLNINEGYVSDSPFATLVTFRHAFSPPWRFRIHQESLFLVGEVSIADCVAHLGKCRNVLCRIGAQDHRSA